MTTPDSAGGGTATAPRADDVPGDAGLVDLLERVRSDIGQLVQTQLELAKLEIKEEVATTAVAAGLLSGATLTGYFVLLMLSFAAAFGLAEVMATGFAFLIVGVVYAAVAGTLFVVGRKKLSTISLVPRTTMRTLKEDMSWLKQQVS